MNAPGATRSKSIVPAMLVLMLVEALSSFEHVMIISALPMISRDFGLSPAAWTVMLFLIVQASTAAIGARLGDMYGRVNVLAGLLAICLIGSLVSAEGNGIAMVILGRGLQGFSGAILPLCYGIARQIAPERSVPFWIGTLTGGYSLAAAVGYVLGGHFVDMGSWRLIFWFSAGYAALLLPLLFLFVPRLAGHGTTGRVDWLGGLLLALGVASLLYGVTSVAGGWSTLPRTALAVAVGAVLLAVWTKHELSRPDPLIQVRLLASRPVLIAIICGAVASLGVMHLPIVLMQFLQQPVETGTGLGVSGTTAGLLKLPSNVVALVAAMIAGWLCGRFGGRRVVQLGGMVCMIFWLLLIALHGDTWEVTLCVMGAAFGSSTLLAAIPNLVLEGVPAERASEATGMVGVVRGLFAAAGAQLITLVLSLSAQLHLDGHAYPTEQGYVTVFVLVGLSGLVIAILAAAYRAPTKQPQPSVSR